MKETTSTSGSFIKERDLHGSERLGRRHFLKVAGVGTAGIALLGMIGCDKDGDGPDMEGMDCIWQRRHCYIELCICFGTIEAAFYIEVANKPYGGMSDWEKILFMDIRDHEIAHRELFKAALGNKAIATLEFNLSGVNFSSRESVLATAKTFEDLGVSAYNGAGWLIKNEAYLLLAGKIVSVEARHAALVRDLIDNGTFANDEVIGNNGLDVAMSPTLVLQAAAPFVKSKIDVRDLPTY